MSAHVPLPTTHRRSRANDPATSTLGCSFAFTGCGRLGEEQLLNPGSGRPISHPRQLVLSGALQSQQYRTMERAISKPGGSPTRMKNGWSVTTGYAIRSSRLTMSYARISRKPTRTSINSPRMCTLAGSQRRTAGLSSTSAHRDRRLSARAAIHRGRTRVITRSDGRLLLR